ncbi:flagellar motor protein MotB [Paracandidimonas soli]|uniref:Chemotaxis protein MotB n=1 Tax=Paracandidimonas soli TaxID=1917182 RepID=A0A4V2VS27_9BURK|nr:flagellar motor protein MotB [Paracandidimonas soli]TCV00790.1 chemotaxis protein MotB [Paracandidimonas soli]
MAGQDRIVIRRKKVVAGAHHGGSWKIAYADFVTAMMAFFLVMWLLSLVPRQDLKAIAEYFRMPLMEAIQGGPQADSGSSVVPGGSPSIIPNPYSLTPPIEGGGEGRTQQPQIDAERLDIERLEQLQSDLEDLIKTDPVLRHFQPQLLLDMTPDGLRVQIIDQQNRPMFATGSAQVQPYMRSILRELGPVFNRLPNSLSISGHTDALQYATGERLYSNWELSADRANAARQELVAGGMSEPKIKQVLGLASTVNLVKDNPFAAVNRRISILVLNQRAERRIDEQNEMRAGYGNVEEQLLMPAPALDDALLEQLGAP